MTSRPVVSVYSHDSASEVNSSVPMPAVFSAPIRNDVVEFVHANMAKNRRQAHGVFFKAGMQHSAESWGTGRAVARIPRISGSGTHRSGQGAFGNMCRKGRMFAPLKVYRRWHRKINLNQRRHAVASALAASAVTPLVMARGHRVQNVPELPLVVDSLNIETTKQFLSTLKKFGVTQELRRIRESKKIRSGKGKMRGTRYTMRKGPLVIYGEENNNVKNAARNLPGIETCSVHRLNLLQLAPGGHLGRFIIWTKDAFAQLPAIFGNSRRVGEEKGGYHMQRQLMSCADLAKIINSDSVQSKLRSVASHVRVHDKRKANPLTNKAMMQKLNPFDAKRKAATEALQKERNSKRAAKIKANRKDKKYKAGRAEAKSKLRTILENQGKSYDAAEDLYLRQELRKGQSDDEEEEDDE